MKLQDKILKPGMYVVSRKWPKFILQVLIVPTGPNPQVQVYALHDRSREDFISLKNLKILFAQPDDLFSVDGRIGKVKTINYRGGTNDDPLYSVTVQFLHTTTTMELSGLLDKNQICTAYEASSI